MPNRSPVTLWKGSIAAPPISIEILEIAAPVVPSAPAVVEGLAMTVTPTKAIFNRGEELAFAIVLKNESAKAFALYDAAFAHDYVLRVGDWQVQYLIQEEREPGPPQILKPGETLSVALRIDADAAQYMWTGPQDKTVPPRKSLPPGKYSVTVSRTFAAAPARLNLAEPSWTGKITSNPVVIEVSPIPALKAKRTDLADLEKQLEDACGGRWEVSGEVLKGIFDLPPEGGAAQNAMFLVFPWNGDEKGAEKAKAFVKDWNRPMEVIWTQEWTVLGGPSGERPQGAITPFQAAVLSVIKRNFQERFDTCDDAVLYVADRAARDDLEFFRAHMTKRATDEWARRLAAMIRKANIVETYKKAGGSYLDLEGGLYFVLPLEDTGNGWIVREFPVLR